MLPKNCGLLLFNAVRETLETMAFAEVVPCSIKVGDEEFSQDDEFSVGPPSDTMTQSDAAPEGNGWGDVPAATTPDAWGNELPTSAPEDDWGTPGSASEGENSENDSWGSPMEDAPSSTASGDSWGTSSDDEEAEWGKSGIIMPTQDPWGETAAVVNNPESVMAGMIPKETDFDDMVKDEGDWVWACMKVNSPDIHSVWFIVTKGLANSLAMNMYAGEAFELDNPLIRDLIAELTNVLGGRLMLLLEEMGGKFTLTVPEIGFGMPSIPEQDMENAVVKVVVDGEHPVIAALCFNPGGIIATGA